jgi:hypothetical protein
MDYLYDAGAISVKTFSTHFEEADGESFIDFGPADPSKMSSAFDAVTIKFDDGYFWNIVPRGIRIGPEGDAANTLEF